MALVELHQLVVGGEVMGVVWRGRMRVLGRLVVLRGWQRWLGGGRRLVLLRRQLRQHRDVLRLKRVPRVHVQGLLLDAPHTRVGACVLVVAGR